jgi:branched-subunit amino acid transport protein AzlD
VEKKLSSFTFQEVSSSDDNILVKHLQEELRNYVSLIARALLLFIVILLVLHCYNEYSVSGSQPSANSIIAMIYLI